MSGKGEDDQRLDDQRGEDPHGGGEQVGQPRAHRGGRGGIGEGEQAGGKVDQGISQVDIPSGGDGDVEQIGGGHGNGRREHGGHGQQTQFFSVKHLGFLLFIGLIGAGSGGRGRWQSRRGEPGPGGPEDRRGGPG